MSTSWKKYVDEIEEGLNALKIGPFPKELYDPIRYTLQMGGKRIRPLLCLLSSEMYDVKSAEVLPLALGVEVFHNFTLLHDDIMDEAPLRRGQATVHKKWNRDIAILSGDVMFVKAYELICQVPAAQLPAVVNLFNATAIKVCEGQQLDMNFEQADASLEEYMAMIESKTAVLLACSLKMGAIYGNAHPDDAELLYEFGRNIGLSFQIQDDFLDTYGDPSTFGKRVGGDIISNKKTYLYLSAIEACNPSQLESLQQAYAIKDEQKKVEKVMAIFNELDVPEKSQKAMQTYYDISMQALNQVSLSQEKKEKLIKLAEQLMVRIA